MNANLPAGIEAYLKEAGFSATEMIILRKLVEEDALTLRELAAKTGKSTGVLDQAMKKLLTKKIVEKKSINDQPKYSIQSLEAIVRWVEKDMKDRKEILERKHRSFQDFITSLKIDKNRPEMEYFHGIEGLEQAYIRLLEAGQELVSIVPSSDLEQDNPLQEFKISYFRKRQYRKIFHRIVTSNSPHARRFQSRDIFEYRKTFLLNASHPLPEFEKTIAGDIVACIDHKAQTACFIRFPGLARAERTAFDALCLTAANGAPGSEVHIPVTADFKTQFFSGMREFFLGKTSVAIFFCITLISAGLTFGLYRNTESLNFERMRDKVSAIAATGVLEITAKDLVALKQKEDWKKPEWSKIVGKLKKIREQNPDVLFVYIFRKSLADPLKLEFVADSHSLNPFANSDNDPSDDIDVNLDGKIDGVDYLQWPGQEYPTPPDDAFGAFQGVRANRDFYEDMWGRVVTGYAPIIDSEGKTIAILAIDIQANKIRDMLRSTFYPTFSFALLFTLFVFARMFAYGWTPFISHLKHRFHSLASK